jgi:hypothetical protein
MQTKIEEEEFPQTVAPRQKKLRWRSINVMLARNFACSIPPSFLLALLAYSLDSAKFLLALRLLQITKTLWSVSKRGDADGNTKEETVRRKGTEEWEFASPPKYTHTRSLSLSHVSFSLSPREDGGDVFVKTVAQRKFLKCVLLHPATRSNLEKQIFIKNKIKKSYKLINTLKSCKSLSQVERSSFLLSLFSSWGGGGGGRGGGRW